jgi:hypothetical protein
MELPLFPFHTKILKHLVRYFSTLYFQARELLLFNTRWAIFQITNSKTSYIQWNNNNSLAWKYKVLKYRTKCFNIVEQVKNSDMRTKDTTSLPIFIIMYQYLRHKCSTDLVLEYCGGKASHVHHWSVIVVSLYYILSIIQARELLLFNTRWAIFQITNSKTSYIQWNDNDDVRFVLDHHA